MTDKTPPVMPSDAIERLQNALDELIKHQLTGSREGMSALQELDDAAVALLALRPVEQAEPIAWESTTPAFVKFITQSRYERFSEKVRAWYKPYRCSTCAAIDSTKEKA